MTVNRKTLLMLVFATVLTAVALVYGFSTIPSPALQRELKLDHERVSSLGELQYSIDAYYRNNNRLPESLNILAKNSYYSTRELNKVDPQTNQPYEYLVINDTKYQLCAVFTTDSENDPAEYDSENYNYSTYKNKFKHSKGRQCFDFTAPPSYQNQGYVDQLDDDDIQPAFFGVGSNGANVLSPTPLPRPRSSVAPNP